MNGRKVFYSCIGLGCIVLLILLYRVADPISANDSGFSYQVEQAVKAAIIAALGWITLRFVTMLWWEPWESKHGKPMSRIVKDIVLVLVWLTDVIVILALVYGQDPSGVVKSLVSLGGMVGAGIGIACRDIVQDYVAGIVLDFTGGYKIGDWVRLPSGRNVQIRAINLRETEFSQINGITTSIGNNTLLSGEVLNYSSAAEDGFWCDVTVTLDRAIPVDRARRLLQAAAASAPGVHNKEAKVAAQEVSGGCVKYMVLYKVAGFECKTAALHNVIQAIMKHLQDHSLNIASAATKTYVGNEALDTEIMTTRQTSALAMLRLSPLFSACTEKELQGIAPVFKPRIYRPGDIIVAEKTRGATMYFVAEGVVEISIRIPDEPQEGETQDPAKQTFIRKHITFLATNDFFGEGSVMSDSPRNATVSAHTDVVAYELSRESLRKILQEQPEMLLKISEAMVARRQETADIANKTQLSLKEQRKMANDFANALKSFLGL